jgi:hypothetical protein
LPTAARSALMARPMKGLCPMVCRAFMAPKINFRSN